MTFAAIAAGSMLLAACGGGDGGNGDNGAENGGGDDVVSAGDEHSFIYLTNDPIGVNKFLESGKIGIEKAAEEYNGTSKTFEGGNEEALRSNLEAAVAEDHDVIVMISFVFNELYMALAEANNVQDVLIYE